MTGPLLKKLGWTAVWLAAALGLRAQQSMPVYLEGEIGVERFADAAVRSVFPAGAAFQLGPSFALANEGRLRLRPQGGVVFFSNQIDENITEQLLNVKAGVQVSYDAYFIGRTTFFPYVALDYNWVSNFDMESYGDDDVSYSENYLRGRGLSQAVGLRVQRGEWYIKAGYVWFRPRLRVQQALVDDDLASGYITPSSHVFSLNTVVISIGFSIRP